MQHGKHLTRGVASDSQLLSLPLTGNSYIPLTLFQQDSQLTNPIFTGKSLPSIIYFEGAAQADVCQHMFGTYSSRQVIKLTCPARGHWICISHLTLDLLSLSKHCVLKLHLQHRGLSWWWRWCLYELRVKHSAGSSMGLHGRVVLVFVSGVCGLPGLWQALK